MRTRLRKVLSIVAVLMIVVIAIGSVLVGVYITKGIEGLIRLPGLSTLLGFDKPRDLGMGPITDADRASLLQKLGGDPDEWPDAPASATRETITVLLTPKEAAAFLLSGHGTDTLQDLQLRIHPDGLVAASGILRIDGILGVAEMSREDIEEQIGAIPDEVPVYLEFRADPNEAGSLGLLLRQMKIGRITVPGTSLGFSSTELDPYVRDYFNAVYGVALKSLTVVDDGFTLTMEVPRN